MFDPCPAWLVKEARGDLRQWLTLLINSSLAAGVLPVRLKEPVIRPLLEKPTLDPAEVGNCHPVSNFSFLAMVVQDH